MLACRFMLGVTEAPVRTSATTNEWYGKDVSADKKSQFYPGALFLLSLFYTKKEIATRMAIFYTGNMIASAFAGLVAAGVFAGLDGAHGLAGWRW